MHAYVHSFICHRLTERILLFPLHESRQGKQMPKIKFLCQWKVTSISSFSATVLCYTNSLHLLMRKKRTNTLTTEKKKAKQTRFPCTPQENQLSMRVTGGSEGTLAHMHHPQTTSSQEYGICVASPHRSGCNSLHLCRHNAELELLI